MPEAVIISVCELIKSITELVKVVVEGQTPEQRKQLWDWYIKDIESWRKLIGLEK